MQPIGIKINPNVNFRNEDIEGFFSKRSAKIRIIIEISKFVCIGQKFAVLFLELLTIFKKLLTK